MEEFHFHSRQPAVEAQSHADKILLCAQAHSSSATENGSCSNAMATIKNVEIDSGDDMDSDDIQLSQCTSVLKVFIVFLISNYCCSEKAY